jgi:hypothetical protein
MLGLPPEEVDTPLVDAQDELGREKADGVLDALDWEEHRVTCVWGHSSSGRNM